eukprot:130528_1
MADDCINLLKLKFKILTFPGISWNQWKHDEFCYTVSISKTEIYPHFHTFPLTSNFITIRSEIHFDTYFIIKNLSLSQRFDLLSSTILFKMLRHYGLYNCVNILYNSNNTNHLRLDTQYEALAALDRCEEFKYPTNVVNLQSHVIGVLMLSNHPSIIRKKHLIFSYFLMYYIQSNFLSLINEESIRFTKCECFLQNEHVCQHCLHSYNLCRMCLGYLMVFHVNIIHSTLTQLRHPYALKSLMKDFWDVMGKKYNVKINSFGYFYRKYSTNKLQRYSITKLQNIGRKYISLSTQYFVERRIVQQSNQTFIKDYGDKMDHFYMLGRINFNDSKFDVAKIYLTMAACASWDLYTKAMSLKSLVINCYRNKEYLIGMNILRRLYQLCKGYILPTFVNTTYHRWKKKFKNKWRKVKCAYCHQKNREMISLKSCKGCMKIFYCTRLCQKMHWKQYHKSKCDLQWVQIYLILNEQIFTRM